MKRKKISLSLSLRKIIGAVITTKREAPVKMSQATLSSKLSVNPTTISRYETGKTSIPLERLEQLSKIFNCPIEDFFQQKDDDPESMMKILSYTLKSVKPKDQKIILSTVTHLAKNFEIIPK